jgi:hypothetical protein
MKSGMQQKTGILVGVLLVGACCTLAQQAQPAPDPAVHEPAVQDQAVTVQVPVLPPYKPRFAGDPAHSDAEAGALGYIRTALTAQKLYKKKHDSFATSLAGLVHTGSFTQRMTKTDRGDYDVTFHAEGKGTGFSLALTPKQYDAAHRAFYSDETGIIRVETDKPATEASPRLK